MLENYCLAAYNKAQIINQTLWKELVLTWVNQKNALVHAPPAHAAATLSSSWLALSMPSHQSKPILPAAKVAKSSPLPNNHKVTA